MSNDSALFYEITFPKRNILVALFRPDDIKRIKEVKKENVVTTEIVIKKSDNSESVYYYDGSLEEFKQHCKKVYL